MESDCLLLRYGDRKDAGGSPGFPDFRLVLHQRIPYLLFDSGHIGCTEQNF